MAGCRLEGGCHPADRRAGVAPAGHHHRAARTASGDPGAVQAVPGAFASYEIHQKLGPGRPETASRVTRVGFEHQFAEPVVQAVVAGCQYVAERAHPCVLVNGVRGRCPDHVGARRIHARDRIGGATEPPEERGATHLLREVLRERALEDGR